LNKFSRCKLEELYIKLVDKEANLKPPDSVPKLTKKRDILSLPSAIIVKIFHLLGWHSICAVAMVCKTWYQLLESLATPFLEARTKKHLRCVFFWLKTLSIQVDHICRQKDPTVPTEMMAQCRNRLEMAPVKEFNMHARSGTRIDFLKATVMLLQDYFKKGQDMREEEVEIRRFEGLNPKLDVLPEYTHILAILNRELIGVSTILDSVQRGKIALGPNFDLIELVLRRYYAHFVLMFSPTGEASSFYDYPSDMIQDKDARNIWESHYGKNTYIVDFERFYSEVLLPEMELYAEGVNDEQFRYYMRYFLNFPVDDTVTVSKWNLITRLFGPYKEFYSNFTKYVLGNGFLGLINRIRAEEILREDSNRNRVLIRFSRTAPLVLAFSVRGPGRKVTHYTNAPTQRKALGLPESKENIPISTFLEYQFGGARLVPMRVDGRKVVEKKNLSNYVQEMSGYEIIA